MFDISSTMKTAAWLLLLLSAAMPARGLNLPPYFTQDMNQFTLTENTEVGSVVYRLEGEDPEGSRVRYGIQGTDVFSVDPDTGAVRVVRPIDRESQSGISDNEIRFSVVIQDTVEDGMDNVVNIPISVIVLDENDNPPKFLGGPYKATVNEDTPVGTTIFSALEARDSDLVGDILEVYCVPDGVADENDPCTYFEIVPRTLDTDIDMYRGAIQLRRPFNYRDRQIYPVRLAVTDGRFNDTTEIVFTVVDVQNSPPIFDGSLTGVASESDPVGSVVMRVTAKDGDTGRPRRIIYELVENPLDYFSIDINTGEIRIDKPLDRESLAASSGVLNLKVKAAELVAGQPGNDEMTSALADVTITIRDVNDEAPAFNQQEYRVSIPENVPFGTPLANLDMFVKDPDTGTNSVFSLRLEDPSGKFTIDPPRATGHTAVSLKVNSQKLDYENPNERKFLLLVIATEEQTEERLSSSATVTVEVNDVNDNHPKFPRQSYTAVVSETAEPGTPIISVTAKDRDSGDFGTAGLRYELTGSTSGLFQLDSVTGELSVAECSSPGQTPCLDYEAVQHHFLSVAAADMLGEGKRTVVNLRVTVEDDNDNPPSFERSEYRANIDEAEDTFNPPLVVKANDPDMSSVLEYSIVDGNTNNLVRIDAESGEITVTPQDGGLRLDNLPTNKIQLNVAVTDGRATDYAVVEIVVRDVNDREPVFERTEYVISIPEDTESGTLLEQVKATDADYGVNAEIAYRIRQGAHDDFSIDPNTGEIKLTRKLNYDTRPKYEIEIEAYDGGVPSLSGTTILKVEVMNRNNKLPYFLPYTQRVQVTEDTEPGSRIFKLTARDEDASEPASLHYMVTTPVTAINKDGKIIEDAERFLRVITVDNITGEVFISEPLDRNSVAVITLTVQVTDITADPPQEGLGLLVVNIIDVNDFAPEFPAPWSVDAPFISIDVKEETPVGTVVHRFTANDKDSNIARFEVESENAFFEVEPGSGKLIVKQTIDFEELEEKRLTFDLTVYDAGIPEKSARAVVVVNIVNVNDRSPVFDEQMYTATLAENSPLGTPIVTVSARDLDEGEFGRVTYYLEGTHKDDFAVGAEDGTVSVVNSQLVDREQMDNILLQVVAVDSAPADSRKSSTVPINITITDVNDNPPTFVQAEYRATIVDNIPFFPEPSPIAQVAAVDPDLGKNGLLFYRLVNTDPMMEALFKIDNSTGVLYPNNSLVGHKGEEFELVVQVTDEGGEGPGWPNPSEARIYVRVDSVNSHKPEWDPAPPLNETISVREEFLQETVIKTVTAVDADGQDNENGRVSYFFKVKNENVGSTDEFSIDPTTGEIRTTARLDREERDHYELVIVARDHGSPVAFETLRFLNVMVEDIDDNRPAFLTTAPSVVAGSGVDSRRGSLPVAKFSVPEEEPAGYLVGKVEAVDPDAGRLGRVYYYIIQGNEGAWFTIDKTQGTIYTRRLLDREERDMYSLVVKASNNPDHVCEPSHCDIGIDGAETSVDETGLTVGGSPAADDLSMIRIQIDIQDINDNPLQFTSNKFFVGIPFDASVGDLILDAAAVDPDLDAKGRILYSIKSSNLFRKGETRSAGSVVPSPFRITDNGRIVLDTLMAEFNQQRFEIDIEARESGSDHIARAVVNLWVYEPKQQIKLVIKKDPMMVNKEKEAIVHELANITDHIVVIDDIRYHVSDTDGLQRHMTDMYVHVVDEATNVIMEPERVVKIVDANYDHLAVYYEESGIHQILPAAQAATKQYGSGPLAIDSNLIAFIALIIALFIGFVTFAVVLCCLRYWHLKPKKFAGMGVGGGGIYGSPESLAGPANSIMMKSPGSMIGGGGGPASAEDGGLLGGGVNGASTGGGTDNPLWIDHKYKAYEEQELTMTVFSDQDNSVISGNGGSGNSRRGSMSQSHIDTQSNAYATINKLPMATTSRRSLFNGSLDLGPAYQDRDYATLDKANRSPLGPVVPGVTSPSLSSSTLPRRSASNQQTDFRGSAYYLNNQGEPQIVGNLS